VKQADPDGSAFSLLDLLFHLSFVLFSRLLQMLERMCFYLYVKGIVCSSMVGLDCSQGRGVILPL